MIKGVTFAGGNESYSVGGGPHYATHVDVGSGELWSPFKTLLHIVNKAIEKPTTENIQHFREEVTKCKSHFQTRQLLTTRPRSAADREELKKSVSEAIFFHGYKEGQNLPVQLVNEAILLSDLFDINEFLALDLLITGEAEMENYPSWPRGLIAVYIYFEGQYSLAATFRTLLKVCPGATWGSNVNPKVIEIANSIVGQALSGDLIDKILLLIQKYDAKKQMEVLDSHLGLGDWRHRTSVYSFLKALKDALGEILFSWSAQRGFAWTDTLRILEFLKTHITLREDFRFSKCDLFLISAVLSAIDNNLNTENFNRSFANELKKYYVANISSQSFTCPEVLELVRLAFHVAIHKRVTQSSMHSLHNGATSALNLGNELLGNEDLLFKADVFRFLKSDLLRDKEAFASEEHVMRLFHQLFCDFISYMPLKLKDMKTRSEENWKLAEMHLEQGLSRPSDLSREYENFLECLGEFYSADTELELGKDYFRPEPVYGSLSKLVRSLCVDSSAMFLSNVMMLSGLAISFTEGVFDILKQSGHNLSLDHFYDSITKYLQTVGSQLLGEVVLPSPHTSVYQSDMFQRVVMNPSRLKPNEISSICAYLELLKSICKQRNVQDYFTTNKKHWFHLTLISAKERGFPMEIRIHLLGVAAAMVILEPSSTEYIMSLWEIFYSTRLIEQGTSDLREELEEKETRLESYVLTVNFLKLIDALVECRFGNVEQSAYFDACDGATIDGTYFEPYVTYIRVSVLQKLPYRAYRDIKERWTLTRLSLRILSNLLDFVPSLIIQMLCDSTLLRTCLAVLVDAARIRDMSTGPITHIDESSYECLNLISRVYSRQSLFLHDRDKNAKEYNIVLVGIQELLMKIHSETGRSEYLLSLLKFIDKLNPETHRDLALQILAKIVSVHSDTDSQLYVTVNSDPNLASIIRYTFCECLDDNNCANEVQNNVLDLLRSSVTHSSPNFGLFMLGVDKKIEFENPGVNGQPRTVLHSLLENLPNLSAAFQTLYVLIKDPRLSNQLLRYLRINQLLVKYYVDHFPQLDMEVEAVGYFLKCASKELKSVQQPGPLAHILVGTQSYKFLSVFEKMEIECYSVPFPQLEFFDKNQVREAFKTCEYQEKDFKVTLIDCKKLEKIFNEDISQLDRATVLRLRKSIQGEAKKLITYAQQWNDMRKTEALKVFLFDCWSQCLEMLVLPPTTLRLVGVEFLTSMIRLLTEKILSNENSSCAFQRRAAQCLLTLCGALKMFADELSNTVLNIILNGLCSWITQETSTMIRALLYTSTLFVMKIMKEKKTAPSSHSSFALIIDALCKDGQSATDVGKMVALYLLGEIIRWNVSKGLGGVVPTALKSETKQGKVKLPGEMQSTFEEAKKILTQNTSTSYRTSATKTPTKSSMFNIPSAATFHMLKNEVDKSILPGLLLERNTEVVHKTQTALMTYLQSKGFLKNIISSLSLSDDEYLIRLFSSRPNASNFRCLLVYEAKMFMLTRLAKSGAMATQLLLGANVLQRLADMKVFDGVYNLENESSVPAQFDYTYVMASDPLSELAVPSKVQSMEILLSSVLTLFQSMVLGSKSEPLLQGVWHFIMAHDESLSCLITYPTESDKVGQAVFFLTSLVCMIGQKIPERRAKSYIYSNLGGVLRNHARFNGNSLEQLHMVRDAILFHYMFATRDTFRSSKEHPCQVILSAKMDYSTQTAATNTEIDLSVGLILKIVHETAKLAYQEYDHDDKRTNYLVEIIETGLTLAYWHVEMALKGMFTKPVEFQRDQQIFQRDLQSFMEGGFVKDVNEATEILVHDMDFIKVMLMRLRRLAHLQN